MSSEIGNTSYDPNAYRDQTFPERPSHGFIEERVSKLEYINDTINAKVDSAVTLSAPHLYDNQCKACGNDLPWKHGNVFPLCPDCLESIKLLTETRNKWVFK